MISSIFFYYHGIVLGDVSSYLETTFIDNNKQQRLLILIYWPLSAPALNSHKLLLCLFTKKPKEPLRQCTPKNLLLDWMVFEWRFARQLQATARWIKVEYTLHFCWFQSGSFYGGNNLHLSTAVMFVALETALSPKQQGFYISDEKQHLFHQFSAKLACLAKKSCDKFGKV